MDEYDFNLTLSISNYSIEKFDIINPVTGQSLWNRRPDS